MFCDYGQEGKTNKFPGKNSRKSLEESDICDERSQRNEVRRSHDDSKFMSFKDAEVQDQLELLKFKKTASQNHGCENYSSRYLSPREEPRLESGIDNNSDGNVIKHVNDDAEKNDIVESSGTFSSVPAGYEDDSPRQRETKKTTESQGYSQIHRKFKNQRSKERKSSLQNITILPSLTEENYDKLSQTRSSISPISKVTSRQTISDFRERKGFEVPSIVLSKPEDEDKDRNTLKLPRIEAASTNSKYLQVSLSSPEPNRLAPPVSFLEPYKASRPPAHSRLEEKSDISVDFIRLPELRTRNSKDK